MLSPLFNIKADNEKYKQPCVNQAEEENSLIKSIFWQNIKALTVISLGKLKWQNFSLHNTLGNYFQIKEGTT